MRVARRKRCIPAKAMPPTTLFRMDLIVPISIAGFLQSQLLITAEDTPPLRSVEEPGSQGSHGVPAFIALQNPRRAGGLRQVHKKLLIIGESVRSKALQL